MPKSVLKFENNEPTEIALAFAQGKITPSRYGVHEVMYTLEYPPEHITFLDLSVSQKINQLRAAQGERLMICKRKGAERNSPVRWDVWLAPSSEKARAAEEAGVEVRPDGRPAWGGHQPEESPSQTPPTNVEPPSLLERQLAASLAEVERLKTAKAERLKAEQAEREKAKAAVVQSTSQVPPTTTRTATASPQADTAIGTAPAPHVATRLENALKTAVAAAYAATEYAKAIGYAAMPMFTSEDLRTMANTLIIDAAKQGGRQ